MIRLLIGLTGGVYRFDSDAGSGPVPVLPGLQPMAFAIDPKEAARVYCATYNRGLWRSTDAGETWLPIGTPQGFFEGPTAGAIEQRETTFVSVDPVPQVSGRHAVWVGTEPSRLYRSTDDGETFELVSVLDLPSRVSWSFPPRPRTHHVQCIAHTSDGGMHLAIEAGAMIRSHDNGNTFKDRLPNSPIDTHVLLTHPLAPRRLYAALGDAVLKPGRSFAESPDGGETWVYSGKGLEAAPYLYGLAIHPGNPEEIWVAASRSPRNAHAKGGSSIFRREADAWVEDAKGFPRDRSLIPVLATHADQPGRWFALSNLGVFSKEPTAKAWACLTAPEDWHGAHPTALAVLNLY
ncbi:exo-alpha-sialidase [Edaphobacter sp. HDX4]|uniref:WD40/YVTN/BNR-like repeat-containing protein n=1 Tax=Edaphobacter sp. HDX4 TaxID=2794064 RepID=UPI002FE563B9